MSPTLSAEQKIEFIRRGFTRRNFGRIATVLAAGATLPFYDEPALAQLSKIRGIPSDAVKINANENPLGPCPEAADAIYNVVKKGGRYMYELTDELAQTMASMEGLKYGFHRAESSPTSPSDTSADASSSFVLHRTPPAKY